MAICERCGVYHDGSFGSGRFCCRSCANARDHSDETKRKTSETLKLKFKDKYGDGISTLTELKKINRKIMKETKYKKFIEIVNNSDDLVFVKYPDIDFGDKYAVYSDGRVLSSYTGTCRATYKRDKYLCVSLVDIHGKSHSLYIHRIVAYNFIPNPNNYPIINHKDENPSNNNVDNLEWCTHQYNNTYNDVHIRRSKAASETKKRMRHKE